MCVNPHDSVLCHPDSLPMALPLRTIWMAVLLLCGGCASPRQRSGTPIDPALLLLTPTDTTSLLWVKVEKLVKTPGFNHLSKSGIINDALALFASQTTFDLRKDFWEVLIVSNGRDNVMLARGQFAPLGMEPEFKKEGSRRAAYRGQTFISTGGIVLTFMSPSSLAAGTRQSLERLVDAHAERRGGPPPTLLERAEKIDRKNQVWWASTSPASLLPTQVPPASGGFSNILANLPRLLNGVRVITGSVDLSGGLNAALTAEFADGARSRESAEALRAFLGLARATIPKERTQQLSFYDTVKVEQKETAMHISIDMPMPVFTQTFR
jgi:hypothetical protein